MKVGFDVSQTGTFKAGCGYFADGLIRQLAADDSSNEYALYPAMGDLFWDPECARSTFSCARPNFKRLRAPKDFETSQRFWRKPGEDFEMELGSPDIIHSNNFYCPLGLKRARLIYTLYDLSFLQEPDWTTEANRIGCFEGVFKANLAADVIVAISEYTRKDFLSTFPSFPADRIMVIYPASRFEPGSPVCRPARFAHLNPESFWLTVGTIEPRKNHRRLLDAFRILKATHPTSPPLVLAGGQGWLMDGFREGLSGLGVNQEVMLLGYVSDSELSWLLRNCLGLVYPSLFEGFGMPVLEALSVGAPVLCSNTTSLPEVGGVAVLYFDPFEPRSIAASMATLLTGKANRDAMKAASREQAKRFSWAASAARLRDIYEHAMQVRHRNAAAHVDCQSVRTCASE